MNDLIGKRKLFLVVLIIVISAVAMFCNLADFTQWTELVKWVSVAYFGANVGEHISNINKNK